MILEDGKFYPMMKAVPGRRAEAAMQIEGLKPAEEALFMGDLLGPLLLKQKNPVLLLFIRQEIRVKEGILKGLSGQTISEKAAGRKEELFRELTLLKRAEALYEKP